jgi:hypothetical protein
MACRPARRRGHFVKGRGRTCRRWRRGRPRGPRLQRAHGRRYNIRAVNDTLKARHCTPNHGQGKNCCLADNTRAARGDASKLPHRPFSVLKGLTSFPLCIRVPALPDRPPPATAHPLQARRFAPHVRPRPLLRPPLRAAVPIGGDRPADGRRHADLALALRPPGHARRRRTVDPRAAARPPGLHLDRHLQRRSVPLQRLPGRQVHARPAEPAQPAQRPRLGAV